MNNRINAIKRNQPYFLQKKRNLSLIAFAVIFALGITSFALYTQTAAPNEKEKGLPTLNDDASVDYLRNDLTNEALEDAIANTVGDDLTKNPEAVVKLTGSAPRPNDRLGSSVAISGDTVVVGAPSTDGGGADTNGAAYIFVRNGSGWSEQQRLTSPDSPADDKDGFGAAVSISGDTLIVGALRQGDPNLGDYGAAYIYVRTGSTWTLQKKLSPLDTPLAKCEGQFGKSVAISGDTVLIGTDGCLQFTEHSAMVHVFVREGTTWTQQALLTAIDEGNDDSFGESAALSGDTAIIGDPDRSGQGPEAAYIFVRCGTEWTRQQRLMPSDGGDKYFGGSVAISGNTVIVGGPEEPGILNGTAGSAYIFVNDGTTWTQQQKLKADSGSITSRYFGAGVGILGDTVVVGKRSEGTLQASRGQALIYARSGTTWTLQETLSGTGPLNDDFGFSAAISPDAVIIGSRFDLAGVGSAYAIDRTTQAPPPSSSPCEDDIEVNIVTDQPDIDLEDDVCDVDKGQSGNQCSLRAAIETANANEGPDEILFNIPGGGTHTISPITQLPSLSETATIDATTQPGYAGSPLIELSGNSTLGGIGFVAGSNNSVLRGMAINRFGAGVGIETSGVSVERCYFGLSPDGSPAGTTADNVIAISISTAAASNNTIGGVGNLGNVISNSNFGVGISAGASGNKVFGNNIGTNAAGTSAMPNGNAVVIQGANGNQIGGETVGQGNLISGNTTVGVLVTANSSTNTITGNKIGTNVSGTEAVANGVGVAIGSSTNNRVGSETAGMGNLISGNTAFGIAIGANASGNTIVGNLIGTNAGGTSALANLAGVVIEDSDDNDVGLETANSGNLISGNTTVGVALRTNASNNRIAGNKIGTTLNGTSVLPNGQHGIFVDTGAEENKLRSNVVGGHNLTNESGGIVLGPDAGTENYVTENSIGVVGNLGTTALPNKYGVVCFADGQFIGSSLEGGNRISHNEKAGIWVASVEGGPNPVVENNTITKNMVGTNGTNDLGNGEFGVWLSGSVKNNPVVQNLVSGNAIGIAVTDGGESNSIGVNRIGMSENDNSAIPNDIGIWIRQSTDTLISANAIAGNTIGILLGTNIGFGETNSLIERYNTDPSRKDRTGAEFTSGNRVMANRIGTSNNNTVIPNKTGIAVGENARSNLIGIPGEPYNSIVGNTDAPGFGIFLGTLAANPSEESLPQFNTFQRNLIGLGPNQTSIANTKGFVLIRAKENTIGGTSDETANVIVGSTQEGLVLADGTYENTILKNFIGVLPPAMRNQPKKVNSEREPNGTYGNGSHGILVENGASGNILGGETSATGLVISDNVGNGIRLASNAGIGNRMGANSISNNALPGIDLGGDGVTPNDPTDADVGPNNLQNYPAFVFSISGGNLIVNYQVDSALANSNYGTTGLTVQFYKADGSGAGVSSLGSDQYTASDYSNGSPGFKKKNLGNAAALGFMAGDTMTATATDADGNSSEFSPAVSSAPSAISGTITYGNAIGAPNPRFVSNVLISGSGSTNVSTTTAAPGAIAGQYTLMGFGAGSYTVTPTKTGGVNNITSFDAARISQHVAGPPNPQLTGNQLLVADVSGNSVVSSFDAAMIAKFVAGPPFAAPGIGSTSTWRFTPTNKNYPSVASSIAGEDYSALLMGEVSGNWNNTGARPAGKVNNGQWTMDSKGMGPERGISVELPTLVSVDKEIVVPVNVQGIANKGVIAYEFDLRYDPTVIQPIVEPADLKDTASRGLLVVTNATEPGLLRVVVYGAYPIDGDGVLLNLRFTSVGAVGSMSPISFGRIMFNEGESRVLVTDGKVELF
ncbi:MAG: hypothetical protein IPL32_03940 [Chloracidobacterium sp.]|nr:hypothetical protein [Chloracidobacterium sp.]